jgi:hypothetical protein
VSIVFRPMKKWPEGVPLERQKAPFKADHSDTLRLIAREVQMIHGVDAMIELALHEKQFTREGSPYRDASPDHPGVIVRVRKPVKNPRGERDMVPLYFPAGRYRTWQANLRAVAIVMEDLRRADRYGVTQNSQQYLGFGRYLPGPTHTGVLTLEAAARFIVQHTPELIQYGRIIENADVYRHAYHAAARKLHPDSPKHDTEQWDQLIAAKTLLDDHHKPKT